MARNSFVGDGVKLGSFANPHPSFLALYVRTLRKEPRTGYRCVFGGVSRSAEGITVLLAGNSGVYVGMAI